MLQDDGATLEKGFSRLQSRAVTGLFVLGLLYTAYFARDILIPVALALLFFFLLSPVVRVMRKRLHIPRPLAAVLVWLALLAGLLSAFYRLSGPAAEWMGRLPQAMVEAEWKLRPLKESAEKAREAAKEVERVAGQSGGNGVDEPVSVVMQGPSLAEVVLGQTQMIGVSALVTMVLLLFLLSSGDTLLRQAIRATPKLSDKKRLLGIMRRIESDISFYLVTVSCINAGLGIALATAMWILGMPNPVLWGVMAAVFNFIPFIGAMAGIAAVSLAALVTFDAIELILLPPLIYLLLNLIEGQVVTPLLLARRLQLNPIPVFLSIIVGAWMWGIVGTLLAVPLLATFKVVCDHLDAMKPLGLILARPGQAVDADHSDETDEGEIGDAPGPAPKPAE